MLQVVEPFVKDGEQQGTVISGQSGSVCLECRDLATAHGQLKGISAKQLAIKTASERGMAGAAINDLTSAPYPVDAEGNTVVDSQRQTIVAYRIDIRVAGRL